MDYVLYLPLVAVSRTPAVELPVVGLLGRTLVATPAASRELSPISAISQGQGLQCRILVPRCTVTDVSLSSRPQRLAYTRLTAERDRHKES